MISCEPRNTTPGSQAEQAVLMLLLNIFPPATSFPFKFPEDLLHFSFEQLHFHFAPLLRSESSHSPVKVVFDTNQLQLYTF